MDEKPQVTGESTPVSPEDMLELQGNLFGEDITGGLQNIKVPPEDLERIRVQQETAEKYIIMNGDEIPHKTDGVITVFTPEELMLLKEVLEKHCVNGKGLDYCFDVMGEDDRYKHQGIIRQLRDTVDMNLDNYVKLRPYSPFFISWVKKVGKKHVRNMQD